MIGIDYHKISAFIFCEVSNCIKYGFYFIYFFYILCYIDLACLGIKELLCTQSNRISCVKNLVAMY